MKKIFSKLLGGVLLFSLSMSLTSCDDILGEWSRPTPNPVTPSGGGSEGGGSSTIAVTGVTLDKANLRFVKTDLTAQTLTATVEPADATDKTLTWTSSDESVATVDANGQVTPIKAGTVTIKATAGDKTATSTVYVYDKIVDINDGAPTVPDDEFWLINGTGTPEANSITIGNGATVTLNGINITQQIICSNTGNSTIILADGSENKVTVSTGKLAGIQIGGTGTTLTINAETAGTGTLTATGGDLAAGIGTGFVDADTKICGTITINGGTVTANGGRYGAGIGTGGTVPGVSGTASNECGAITINGGTVTANGGEKAAGIGTGLSAQSSGTASNKCGAITIGTGVISVTAKKSDSNPGPNSIGKGLSDSGTQTCGVIKFGTAEVFSGTAWSPSDPLTAGPYGGLKLVISKKNYDGDTWTLTPAE